MGGSYRQKSNILLCEMCPTIFTFIQFTPSIQSSKSRFMPSFLGPVNEANAYLHLLPQFVWQRPSLSQQGQREGQGIGPEMHQSVSERHCSLLGLAQLTCCILRLASSSSSITSSSTCSTVFPTNTSRIGRTSRSKSNDCMGREEGWGH